MNLTNKPVILKNYLSAKHCAINRTKYIAITEFVGLCVEDEKHGDAHLQLQASAESIEDILANHQHLTSTLEALDDVVQKRSDSVKVSSKTPKFKTTDTIRLKRSFSENGRIAKFAKNFTTTVSVGDHQQGITK